MDTEKIKSLCAVVETGSMSEAARGLYCSQPAVSKHIAALEDEFQCRIFIREGKRLILTEGGKRIYAFCTRYREDYQQLQNALYHLRLRENHCIAFGATNFIGTYLVPQALAAYKETYPDRQIVFTIDFWSNLLALLMRGEIAFALVPQTDELLAREELERFAVAEDPMCLALPAGHALARRKAICAAQLLRIPLLVPQETSAARRFVMERFAALGLTPHNLIDLGTTQAVKQGVVNGLGVGILSRRSVRMEEQAGKLICRPVEDLHLIRTLYVIKRKTRPLLEEEQAWVDMLRRVSAQSLI